MKKRILAARAGLTLLLLLMFTSPALAQSEGIVVVDRATVWQLDSSVVITVLPLGTVVELTGQSDRWYEIVVPERFGGRGARGLVAIGQIELVAGSDSPPVRPLRGSTAPTQAAPPRRATTPPAGRSVNVRGFGQAGVMAFAARESFEAVFGRAYGPTFGGGVQLQFRSGPYVQGSIERFRQTGERVFVFDGTTFPLGIPQTLTIHPLMVSAGYRFPSRRAVLPYVGGGVGVHLLREESPFDEAAERVDERHASYHAHGGIELRTPYSWIAPAVEAKFTTVPDALGSDGASAAFEETNLGGWQLQLKLLIGR